MPGEYSFTAPEPAAPKRASGWRRILIASIVLVCLVLAVVAGVFIWGAQRFRQGIELAKEAREQYGSLDARFPFTPPAAGKAPAAAQGRWPAMLRVRRRVQERAAPQLRATLATLLASGSLGHPALYRELLTGVPLLQPLLAEQLAGLEREQMSAREYQWLMGLAITAALESPGRYPCGKQYWQVLNDLARVTRSDADPRNDMDPQAALRFFQRTFAGTAPPPEGVVAQLQCPDPATGAIDLTMVAMRWAGEKTLSQSGTGISVR